MLESFMEDLLWKYPDDFFPRHGFKQAARQFTLSDGGRLDISFRDGNDRLWVVEVKAVPIRIADADQVDRYARKLREANPNDPPIPAVVAPVINSTVGESFDRWGIEHFEIREATFRRVAFERGVEMDLESAAAPELDRGADRAPRSAAARSPKPEYVFDSDDPKCTATPKDGDHIAWVRGTQFHELIRIHAMGPDAPLTLCKILNTATSPYLGTRGHMVLVTDEPVTCKSCLRMLRR